MCTELTQEQKEILYKRLIYRRQYLRNVDKLGAWLAPFSSFQYHGSEVQVRLFKILVIIDKLIKRLGYSTMG